MKNTIYKSEQGRKEILNFYKNILDTLRFNIEKIIVPTKFGDSFIITGGNPESEPLILLHGTATNSAVWLGDFEKYSKYFHVYAVDIIGEPGNSSEERPEFDTSYSDWLNEIFNYLKIEKANIIGMSIGGWIAASFTINNPEKVNRLVLLCPSGFAPQKISFIFQTIPLMLLGNYGFTRMNRIIYYKEKIYEEVEKFGKLIFKYFKPRLIKLPIFTNEEIKKIDMPLFLIVGEKDALLKSIETAKRINQILPLSKIEIRKETGHAILNTFEDIIRFLRK